MVSREKGANTIVRKTAKQALIWSGTSILVGALLLVDRMAALSPWVWAACLGAAGLGALGLYLADRSDSLVLFEAYLLWAVAGLIALVPTGVLRDEAVAAYVLLAIALPFVGIFVRDRRQWRALIPAYPLIAIVGAIGLAQSGLFGDDLISAYILIALAVPFFAVYARDRRRRWALIPGGILALLGLSIATWLPWHAVRSELGAGTVLGYAGALVLLVFGASLLARGLAGRASG
jgi:hypothetical protein